MLAIPLYLLLFLYFVFLAVFLSFVIINLYHLSVTGAITFASFTVTLTVFVLAAFTIFTTWYILQGTPWQESVTLFGSSTSGNWFSL